MSKFSKKFPDAKYYTAAAIGAIAVSIPIVIVVSDIKNSLEDRKKN